MRSKENDEYLLLGLQSQGLSNTKTIDTTYAKRDCIIKKEYK